MRLLAIATLCVPRCGRVHMPLSGSAPGPLRLRRQQAGRAAGAGKLAVVAVGSAGGQRPRDGPDHPWMPLPGPQAQSQSRAKFKLSPNLKPGPQADLT
jgi:hypothetical protein